MNKFILEFYDKKYIDNKILIERIKLIDDKAFGSGSNIENISIEDIKNILENGFILGLTEDKELIAHIQIEYKVGYWYIYGVSVDPDFQGRGLAHTLLGEVIQKARKAKCKKLQATVREDNIPSLYLFLNKNNFLITAFLKNHFGTNRDRLLIELDFENIKEVGCENKKDIKTIVEKGFLGFKINTNKKSIFFRKEL